MTEHRPDPEKILEQVQQEALKQHTGKLKIYLGAAPGVGKTYTMLHDAIEIRRKGFDVVVGIVESHGRHDINKLYKQLEVLPKQTIHYRGNALIDLDLDAALQRAPGLVLIDEMAHTNAPGLRHLKRWQDINELLDRGIDVWTTLNVQHIESLNDDVMQIIQVPVKETVPDSMIDRADTIELIDLPPEDLIKRLREGKVYIPAQAEVAMGHFFRKGNLIALRELALRITALRVGADILTHRQGEGVRSIWRAQDKILVCVDGRSSSIKLIRAAKRFASSLQAEWHAIYVETPVQYFSHSLRNKAVQYLRLAEQLGAETHVISGFHIAKDITRFAREQNITQIMVWKTVSKGWFGWLHRHTVDAIVRDSHGIDVYIMTGVEKQESSFASLVRWMSYSAWDMYACAMGAVTLITGVGAFFFPFITATNVIMMYFLGILAIALLGKTGPSILVSCLSVIAYGIFFVPPFNQLAIDGANYIFTLIAMLTVASMMSYMITVSRRQADVARTMQRQTAILYNLSQQLTKTRGIDALLHIGISYIEQAFDSDVIMLFMRNEKLTMRANNESLLPLSEKEQSIARWVYDTGQPAGLGTDTLSFSPALYLPLIGSNHTIGVVRVCPSKQHLFSPEQRRSLEACANQVALALEVERLQAKTQRKEIKKETRRVRTDLLHAISTNFREPLLNLMGAAYQFTAVQQEDNLLTQHDLYYEIEELNRLNNNILQITRLETDSNVLQQASYAIEETIQKVLKKYGKHVHNRKIRLVISKDIPPVRYNDTLIQEVLLNLVDNAVKFSETGTEITISAALDPSFIVVSVADVGVGVNPLELNRLFDAFYRGQELITHYGLGLGLTICQKIIDAHYGKIWAENMPGGGAVFRFTLPLS